MNALLDRLFKLKAHGTTVSTEVVAGMTTFITMVYIIFVNPADDGRQWYGSGR